MKLITAFACSFLLLTVTVRADVRLPRLFGNNVVLQQKTQAPIWGWADVGEKVGVRLGEKQVEAIATADGKWMVNLPTPAAGGPYELTVSGKNTITIKNILIGEVWLAAGQSNMDWVLARTTDAEKEVAAANYPQIHFIMPTNEYSTSPRDDFQFKYWQECTPATAGSMSAVGYFFARALYQRLKIPIGIICNAIGGTTIQSWAGRDVLTQFLETKPQLEAWQKQVDDYPSAKQAYEVALKKWEDEVPHKDEGIADLAKGWAESDLDTTDWKPVEVPVWWENTTGLNIDGGMWFRREIDLPAHWAGQSLRLTLGEIDDYDVTYFNGKQIGATHSPADLPTTGQHVYKVPGDLVKAGRNVITVRIFDSWGEGGFTSPPMGLQLQGPEPEPIRLKGTWKYKVEKALPPITQEQRKSRPALKSPFTSVGPTVMYNTQLLPAVPFAIKGALWYQGEYNAGDNEMYRKVLPAMIREWRGLWGQGDFPFYSVQLPRFGTKDPPPHRGYPEFRQTQTALLSEPNTGIAVTIDTGHPTDIHPPDKQEVGRRLALLALNKTYGLKDIVASGPALHSMKVEGGKIRVEFEDAGGGLIIKGDKLLGFAIAGDDKKWAWAEAKLAGNSALVWSDQVPQPKYVRYGWADFPDVSLYNKAGLPAVPFSSEQQIIH